MALVSLLLGEDSDTVEADLQRYYHVDLADFWRGELSLRRLSVLVNCLPSDSATARSASSVPAGWDVHAFLLADLYHCWTGSPHPERPQPKKASRYAELRRALEAQKERTAPTTQ